MIDNKPVHLLGPVPSEVIPIRARDLGTAQREYARLRRQYERCKMNTPDIAVILEIEVHIADDARTARRELAAAGVGDPTTVRYVGTGHGLAGLIVDIVSASVADGVLLRPTVQSGARKVLRSVVDDIDPLLRAVPVYADRVLPRGESLSA